MTLIPSAVTRACCEEAGSAGVARVVAGAHRHIWFALRLVVYVMAVTELERRSLPITETKAEAEKRAEPTGETVKVEH